MKSNDEKINIIKSRGWEEYENNSWIMFYYKTRKFEKIKDSKDSFGYLLTNSLDDAFNSLSTNKFDGFLRNIN